MDFSVMFLAFNEYIRIVHKCIYTIFHNYYILCLQLRRRLSNHLLPIFSNEDTHSVLIEMSYVLLNLPCFNPYE
jgi:hypothetical protein